MFSLNILGWDLSNVESTEGMFSGCHSLTTIPVASWVTPNLINMASMFNGCYNLTDLNFQNINTFNVQNMDNLFNACSGLRTLRVENVSGQNVISAESMFAGCTSLTAIHLLSFNTDNLTYTDNMFLNCDAVTEAWGRTDTDCEVLNASTGRPSNIEFISVALIISGSYVDDSVYSQTFSNSAAAKQWLDENKDRFKTIDYADSNGLTTTAAGLFEGFNNAINISVSGLNFVNITDMSNMFADCTSLETLNLSSVDLTGKNIQNMLTNTISVTSAFAKTAADAKLLNTTNTANKPNNYQFGIVETELQKYNRYYSASAQGIIATAEFENAFGMGTSYVADDTAQVLWTAGEALPNPFREDILGTKPTGMIMNYSSTTHPTYTFAGGLDLTTWTFDSSTASQLHFSELPIQSIEFGESTSSQHMIDLRIRNCTAIENIDISKLSGVLLKERAFAGCTNLKTIDVGTADVETNTVAAIFEDCTSLTRANIQRMTNSSAYPSGMFKNCRNLTSFNDKDYWPYLSVEYVQTTGSQYLPLNINLPEGTDFKIVVEASTNTTSEVQYIYGTDNGSYVDQCFGAMFYNDRISLYNRGSSLTSTDIVDTNTTQTTQIYTIEQTRVSGRIDNQEFTYGEGLVQALPSNEIYLFAVNRGGDNPQFGLNGRVYRWYLQLNDGTMVMDLRPAALNGEVGMYDIVNHNFLTIQSIDDTMASAGPELPNTYGEHSIKIPYNFKTAIQDASSLLESCVSLSGIDLTEWIIPTAINLDNAFAECTSISTALGRYEYECDILNASLNKASNVDFMPTQAMALSIVYTDKAGTITTVPFDTPEQAKIWITNNKSNILEISYVDEAGLTTDASDLFYECTSATRIDISLFNTMNVTNMSRMFSACYSAEIVGLDTINTSNVTNMSSMFAYSRTINGSEFSAFDTTSVTNMTGMFGYTQAISYDLSSFDMQNVSATSNMFYNCENMSTSYGKTSADCVILNAALDNPADEYFILKPVMEIVITGTNTTDEPIEFITLDPVEAKNYISTNRESLKTIQYRDDTGLTTDANSLFYQCTSLVSADLSLFNFSNVTAMSYMFSGCTSLTSVDLTDLDVSKTKTFNSAFANCSNLESISATNWNAISATNVNSMFNGCSSLQSIDLSGLVLSETATTSSMFSNCPSVSIARADSLELCNLLNATLNKSINVVFLMEGASITLIGTLVGNKEFTQVVYNEADLKAWITTNKSELQTITYIDTNGMTSDATSLFEDATNLTTVDFTQFNTINVSKWLTAFEGCVALSSIDMTGCVGNNVTTMARMFASCEVLKSLDLSTFITPRLNTLSRTFYRCFELSNLDISNLNTNKVTNLSETFWGCAALTSLDLSNFNTESVTNMYSTFAFCDGLTELNITNFNTAKVTNMGGMLSTCSLLTNIDVSSFDTSSVINMEEMFAYNDGLVILDLSTFDMAGVTNTTDMFAYTENVWIAYGKTQADCDILNASSNKPNSINFLVKGAGEIIIAGTLTSGTDFTVRSSNFLEIKTWITTNASSIETLVYNDLNGITTSGESLFEGCTALRFIDISNFNTENITTMRSMFENCKSLLTLDVSNFNTSNVTNMANMFRNLAVLETLDLTNFDFTNVTNVNNFVRLSAAITTAYAKTQADCDKLNASSNKPANVVFTVKIIFSDKIKLTIENIGASQPVIIEFESKAEVDAYVTDEVKANVQTLKYADHTGLTTSLSKIFAEYPNLESLDVSELNTDNLTNMNEMFADNPKLTNLTLGNFKTQNVTSMHGMFARCTSLVNLNLTTFDTSNVTSMIEMFSECSSLASIDLTGFNTNSLLAMDAMFQDCISLSEIDLSSFTATNLISIHGAFWGCSKITTLDLSHMIADKLQYISVAFLRCSALHSVKLPTANKATLIQCMEVFYECTALESVDMSMLDISNVTDISRIFVDCSALISVDFAGWNTTNVTAMDATFYGCTSLAALDVTMFNTVNTTSFASMLQNCSSLTNIDLSSFEIVDATVTLTNIVNGCTNASTAYGRTLTECEFLNNSYGKPDNVTFTIEPLIILSGTMVDGSSFYEEYKTPTAKEFLYYNASIKTLKYEDASGLTTNASDLFCGCTAMTNIDLSGFNTSNVTDMTEMFRECESLIELDLTGFNTSKVTKMGGMFRVCESLKNLNLSMFNTSKVTDMSYMFDQCSALLTLDLTSFNTSNVTAIQNCFTVCTSLKIIDLSSFDTSAFSTFSLSSNLFWGSTAITTAYGRTQTDCDVFNAMPRPANVYFVVKP